MSPLLRAGDTKMTCISLQQVSSSSKSSGQDVIIAVLRSTCHDCCRITGNLLDLNLTWEDCRHDKVGMEVTCGDQFMNEL